MSTAVPKLGIGLDGPNQAEFHLKKTKAALGNLGKTRFLIELGLLFEFTCKKYIIYVIIPCKKYQL